MVNCRTPGPLGVSRQLAPLDDGTLGRWLTPPPGPVCCSWSLYDVFHVVPEPATPDPDVGFLFNQCRNPGTGLGERDYTAAAVELEIEVAMIRAITDVESPRGAFDDMGRPTILFERHYFHRLTSGRYDKTHADLSDPSSGGYGKYAAQYGKLERAYALDRDAALKSASWGRFQIMGSNHAAAGYSSAAHFVLAMASAESEHLKAFVSFVATDKSMLAALRDKNWAGFAKRYNGPSYAKNQYDTKLKAAYERHRAAAEAHPVTGPAAAGKSAHKP